MERLLQAKRNSEIQLKPLISQYEVDKIEALSKPKCIFQINIYEFSQLSLDFSKRNDYRYTDIAKVEIS
jgi:hypothetical protein